MIFPSNDIVLGILRPLVKWVQSQCLRCMYLCECVCVCLCGRCECDAWLVKCVLYTPSQERAKCQWITTRNMTKANESRERERERGRYRASLLV